MSTPWDGYIPAGTLEHYQKAGFAKKSSIGKSPALLVIDVQYKNAGEGPMPLSEAISYHPMNCGEHAWNAIGHIQKLIAAFRNAGFPIIYPFGTPMAYQPNHNRMPSKSDNPRHAEIVAEVAPQLGDILLPKTAPSAFFGTPIIKYLNSLKADTLFMVGNTTSGCIRASVIDGYSNDFKVIVPHDGCYDRAPMLHAINLFDMAYKYAEVVSTAEAVEMINSMAAPTVDEVEKYPSVA